MRICPTLPIPLSARLSDLSFPKFPCASFQTAGVKKVACILWIAPFDHRKVVFVTLMKDQLAQWNIDDWDEPGKTISSVIRSITKQGMVNLYTDGDRPKQWSMISIIV